MNETDNDYNQEPQAEPEPQSEPVVTPEPDRDLLIDNLSYEEAREYVMGFLIVEKKTRAALHEKTQELSTWNERLALAEQKGLSDLLEKAKRHLHFLAQEKAKLTAELEALQRKNIVLKEKLGHKAKTAGIPSSAFAESLLDNLSQLADVEEYKLKEAMKQQEAEDELAKLKAKLGM